MGLFDWAKQLENGVGNFFGGLVHGAENVGNQIVHGVQQAAPVAGAVAHSVAQAVAPAPTAFHDFLAQFGTHAPPNPHPTPIFQLTPPPTATPSPVPAYRPGMSLAQIKAAQWLHDNGGPVDPNYQSHAPNFMDIAKQAAGGIASDAMHMVTQAPVHLALQGVDMINNNPNDRAQFQAKPGTLPGFLFGTQPIDSYQSTAEQFAKWAHDKGLTPAEAGASSVLVAPLLGAMDFAAGGKGKAVAEGVAKAATAEDVTKVLTQHLGAETASKIPQPVIHQLASETNPSKVATILKGGGPAPVIDHPPLSEHGQAVQSLLQDTGKTADQLRAQVAATKEQLTRTELGNMLQEIRNGKVEQGTFARDAEGNVTARAGRYSTNPEWYKQLYRGQADHGMSISKKGIESAISNARPKSKLYQTLHAIAETRLRGHYTDPVSGPIPHNPTFVGAERMLKGIDEVKAQPTPVSHEFEKWTAMGGKPEDFPFKSTEEQTYPESAPKLVKPDRSEHTGNSNQTPELHDKLPIRNTPETPMLSSEHMDIPGKAPVDFKRAKIKLQPAKNESSLVKGFTSIRNVIRRQGEGGKELAQRMVAVRERHQELGQTFMDATKTVQKLNKSELKNFADTVQGVAAPKSKKIARAVTEWQSAARNLEETARNAGITMGHIESYFPHMFKNDFFTNPKTFTKAAEHLVNTGQASDLQAAVQMINDMREPWQGGHKYGNLEKARQADIPGYRIDHKVIPQYIDKATRRIAEAEHFGVNNEHVDRLTAQIAKEGKDANAAQEAFNRYFNPEHTGTVDKLATKARTGSSFLTLSKAVISHSTQTANTAIVAGTWRTAKAWMHTILSPKDRAWVKSIGINYDGRAGGHISATAPFLKQMRATNRTVSALVGREYGNALARSGKVDILKNKWGVQGDIGKKLTSEQEAHMAHAMADATQFSDDPADLPMWARTPAGKLVGQYRMSYTYKQGGFIFDHIIKEAGRGNIAPALRALAIVPVAGAAVVEAKHLLGNKATPTSDPMATIEAGGGGNIPLSLLDSTKYMYDGRSTAEGVAGDVAPLAGQAVQTAYNIHDAMGGNSDGLGKQTLSYIPFVGNLVKNAVYPSGPTDPNAIAYVQNMDKAGKTLTDSKDKALFDALYGSNKDSSGNKIPASYDPNNSPYVAEALLAHPNVLAAATQFYQAFQAQSGQAVDPVYLLNPKQQQAALEMRAASAFPGELSSDKKQLATQLPANWSDTQSAYYNQVSKSIQLANAQKGVADTYGGPKYPEQSAQVQADFAAGNTKSQAVQDWYTQLDAYNNQKRTMMGLPTIAPYGFAPNQGQIPNPSNPYAKKSQGNGSASTTFASKSGGSGGGGRKSTRVKTAKVAKVSGAATISRKGVVSVPKGSTPKVKMPKVKLAKATTMPKVVKTTKVKTTGLKLKTVKVTPIKGPKRSSLV